MAKTLLQGVNDVLKKVGFIAGDSGELASLTNSARQTEIDISVQNFNSVIEELYDLTEVPRPDEYSTTDITLVADDRDYQLPNDLVQIRWPLIDRTNGYTIHPYPGGFDAMRVHQRISSDYTGRPLYGCIRPSDGELYLDRIPQSADAGLVYECAYDKDVSLSSATDTFPFSDACYRQVVLCVAEKWKEERRNAGNIQSRKTVTMRVYNKHLAQAARFLTKEQKDSNWVGLAKVAPDPTDPYANA